MQALILLGRVWVGMITVACISLMVLGYRKVEAKDFTNDGCAQSARGRKIGAVALVAGI